MRLRRQARHMVLLFALCIATAGADTQPGVFTARSFAAIRAHHAHQPLVVHLWGVTCAPCLIELPKLAALQHKHPSMKLVLIQVDPVSVEAVEQVLRQVGLTHVEHWHVSGEFDEHLRYSIDKKWSGEIPRTLLVSRNGDVIRIQGAAEMGRIEEWLRTTRR